jgi:hypothetical protein
VEPEVSESSSNEIPVNFSSFVVSLASSAMMHLGEAPDPITRQKQVDLPLARQTIDLLGVLKDKTKGNLEEDETNLLDTLLHELRTRWLEISARSGG